MKVYVAILQLEGEQNILTATTDLIDAVNVIESIEIMPINSKAIIDVYENGKKIQTNVSRTNM